MITVSSQSMMTTKAYYKGEDGMNANSLQGNFAYPSEFDVTDSSITRELIMQYINAGILFPEEIRQAEELLRQNVEVTIIS